MLDGSKKYRGIKFLNVDQKFLNVKVLNKKTLQKSVSINTPISSNKSKEKSGKSSANDYPYGTEEEKSPRLRNISIKRSYKKINSCKRLNTFKDQNLFKNIKKKNFEERKEGEASSLKINKSKPNRINSLRNFISCKNINVKSSLFNVNAKSSLFKKKNQTTKSINKDNNININNSKNPNQNTKKRNKTKNKKVKNKNINENDSANIIKVKTENTDNKDKKDKKDNKDKNENDKKSIKKFFCCL